MSVDNSKPTHYYLVYKNNLQYITMRLRMGEIMHALFSSDLISSQSALEELERKLENKGPTKAAEQFITEQLMKRDRESFDTFIHVLREKSHRKLADFLQEKLEKVEKNSYSQDLGYAGGSTVYHPSVEAVQPNQHQGQHPQQLPNRGSSVTNTQPQPFTPEPIALHQRPNLNNQGKSSHLAEQPHTDQSTPFPFPGTSSLPFTHSQDKQPPHEPVSLAKNMQVMSQNYKSVLQTYDVDVKDGQGQDPVYKPSTSSHSAESPEEPVKEQITGSQEALSMTVKSVQENRTYNTGHQQQGEQRGAVEELDSESPREQHTHNQSVPTQGSDLMALLPGHQSRQEPVNSIESIEVEPTPNGDDPEKTSLVEKKPPGPTKLNRLWKFFRCKCPCMKTEEGEDMEEGAQPTEHHRLPADTSLTMHQIEVITDNVAPIVCRITFLGLKGGTGFIIGSCSLEQDSNKSFLIITSYHLEVKEAIENGKPCIAEFGYYKSGKEAKASVSINSRVIAYDEGLDYILLSLKHPDELNEYWNDNICQAKGLGKMITKVKPPLLCPIIIIGHPDGHELKFDMAAYSVDRPKGLVDFIPGKGKKKITMGNEYIFYQSRSFKGASGAPVVSHNEELYAIHAGGSKKYGVEFGVFLWDILRHIKENFVQKDKNSPSDQWGLSMEQFKQLFPKFNE